MQGTVMTAAPSVRAWSQPRSHRLCRNRSPADGVRRKGEQTQDETSERGLEGHGRVFPSNLETCLLLTLIWAAITST